MAIESLVVGDTGVMALNQDSWQFKPKSKASIPGIKWCTEVEAKPPMMTHRLRRLKHEMEWMVVHSHNSLSPATHAIILRKHPRIKRCYGSVSHNMRPPSMVC